jgi:hypothetical protein
VVLDYIYLNGSALLSYNVTRSMEEQLTDMLPKGKMVSTWLPKGKMAPVLEVFFAKLFSVGNGCCGWSGACGEGRR